MKSFVTGSAMALRALWLVNLVLGAYLAYLASGDTRPWVIVHVFTGVLVVAILWFLGIAQALVKGGSLMLTGATFLIGLALTLIGMAQVAVPNGVGLIILQVFHVVFVVLAIASGEICIRRYRTGIAAA